jgi:hypothetical protein
LGSFFQIGPLTRLGFVSQIPGDRAAAAIENQTAHGRDLISPYSPKRAGPKSSASPVLRLRAAKQRGTAAGIRASRLTPSSSRVLEKIEDPCMALAALTSLVKNSHGH